MAGTRVVRLAEAARQHGVSPMTIRRRIADGTITAYRLGPKLIMIDLDELNAAMTPIPAARRSVVAAG